MAENVQLIIKARDQASGILKKLAVNGKFSLGKLSTAAIAATAAIVGLGVAGIVSAAKLEKGIAEVGTLMNKSASEMKGFSEGVKDIMARTGAETETLTKGLFDLVSAGVDASKSIEVLGVAADLADAGVTNVSIAVDGMTSILNAYNLSADEATMVSDKLFQAQKLGKTTVAELSGAIGKLAPITSAANISIDEMFAALSTVTLAGISTDEAVTSLVATMNSLIKPQESAVKEARKMGIELGANALKTKGLTKVLEEITEATKGDIAAVNKLGISQRGLKAALTLTADEGKKYKRVLKEMADSQGVTKIAADQMRETFFKQFEILKGKLIVALIELGEKVLPLATEALIFFNKALDQLIILIGDKGPEIELGIKKTMPKPPEVDLAWREVLDINKRSLEELNKVLAGGHIKILKRMEERKNKTISDNKLMLNDTKSFTKAMSLAWKNYTLKAESVQKKFANFAIQTFDKIGDRFGDSVNGLIFEGKSFKDSMKNLFKEILKDFIKMIIAMTIKWLAFKALTAGFGGFLGFAEGGIVPGGLTPVSAANGGIFRAPTLAVIGDNPEREEAVIPLKGGKVPVEIKRNENTGNAGNQFLTINFNGPILGDEEQAREFAIKIDEELHNLQIQGQSLVFA